MTGVAGSSVTSVTIGDYPSLSPLVAAAFSAEALPSLRDLTLWLGENYDPAVNDVSADTFTDGFMKLLWTAGPRLERFKLEYNDGEYSLPALALQALEACSRLQHLDLDAGAHELWSEWATDKDAEDQDALLATVASLTNLRSLELHGGPIFFPEATHSHASRLELLSALTGLTQLRLALRDCTNGKYTTGLLDEPPNEADRVLRHAAWERQRACLLSAVARMPGLQRLCLDGMTLGPQHMERLAHITHLELMGVLAATPPSPFLSDSAEAGAVEPSAGAAPGWFRSVLLPPALQSFTLHAQPSPRLLAALRPPPGLQSFRVEPSVFPGGEMVGVSFGNCDVTGNVIRSGEGWQHRLLLPDTPVIMAAAAAFLEQAGAFSSKLGRGRKLSVSYDVYKGRVLPPKGLPDGHASWMQPLRRLQVDHLQLRGVMLEEQDVYAMVKVFDGLKGLELFRGCRLPAHVLHVLGSMPGLGELKLYMETCQLQGDRQLAEATFVTLLTSAAEARSQWAMTDGVQGGGVAGSARSSPGPVLRVQVVDCFQVPDWLGDMVEAVRKELALKGLPCCLDVRGRPRRRG